MTESFGTHPLLCPSSKPLFCHQSLLCHSLLAESNCTDPIIPIILSLPSSGLVNALSNEVCWEGVFKILLVLKWVVNLGVRHAATLEPAVKYLFNPPQDAFTTP